MGKTANLDQDKDAEWDVAQRVNGEGNDAYLTDLNGAEDSVSGEGEDDEEMLTVIEGDMRLTFKLLVLASDAVRKDAHNLPIQVGVLCFDGPGTFMTAVLTLTCDIFGSEELPRLVTLRLCAVYR